jgi:beta-xylosidase
MRPSHFAALLLAAGCLAPLHAPAAEEQAVYRNPVIDANLADPAVILHDGVYYLYATGDVDGDNGTRAYTSTDLVNWKRGPVVFRPGEPHVWAPDVWRDPASGRFYLYYTVNHTVGVAEAEGSLGPFAIHRKLFDRAIDAHLFRDDDGRLFLYFVQLPGFRITVQPMAGPAETKGEPRVVLKPEADWEKRAGHVTEGPWLLKDRGRYHLLYSGSGANTPEYAVGYATSDSPLGPFKRAAHNPIVRRSDGLFGPGHGCAIRDGAGRWWHVYHQKRNDRVEWNRFICLDPLWFDSEGHLRSRATRGETRKAPVPPAPRPQQEPPPVRDEEGVIRNGTSWRDTAGKEIWSNGGHIIREGDVFYWVGYDTGPRRPCKVNLYSSRNLADWTFESTAMRREGKFAHLGWAGRPALLHCAAAGKYVIVFEADSPRRWRRHKVGFAVCDRIDGRYELVNAQYPEGNRSTGDQSVYQEGDRAYLLATLDRDIDGRKYLNQSLAIFQLSADFQRVERKLFEGFDNVSGNTRVVPRDQSSREASHIVKVGETYYWFSSGLVGWSSSATMYATARRLAGPWSDLKVLRTDPASEDSYNTQHDFVPPVAGSEATTHVYAGDRYSQWTRRGTGRNIFLPLVFEGGEPVLRWYGEWTIHPATGRWREARGG